VARLQQLLPGFEVCFGAAVDELGRHGQRQRFGNLVATRLPLAQVQHYPLPCPADAGVRSMPRMCTNATVLTPLGPLRIMTTHLEFYSTRQRLAQAKALIELHDQACQLAAQRPLDDETGQPFQNKVHTPSAVLCGDFNLETDSAEYSLIQSQTGGNTTCMLDAWKLAHGEMPHDPTFRLFDHRYGPVPICCDFVFVTEDLKQRVKRLEVNATSRASDHQPVMLELG
jgi:endonuclease/exonuclease/phosphatase family metal-dependent hydrolase